MIDKAPFAKFLTVTAALMALASPTAQADDYFLKFDGVQGEATEKNHKNWIDINSFSWGAHAVSGSAYGGGSKIEFDDFSWTQRIDASTPPLFNLLATGNTSRKPSPKSSRP